MKIVNVMRSEYERRAVPPPLNSYIISGKRDSCQQVCVKILNLSYMYYESNHVPLLLSVTSLRKKVYLYQIRAKPRNFKSLQSKVGYRCGPTFSAKSNVKSCFTRGFYTNGPNETNFLYFVLDKMGLVIKSGPISQSLLFLLK